MANDSPNSRRCKEFDDGYIRRYFNKQLEQEQSDQLSVHLINCKGCFDRVQKWGRFLRNGEVSIENKAIIEYDQLRNWEKLGEKQQQELIQQWASAAKEVVPEGESENRPNQEHSEQEQSETAASPTIPFFLKEQLDGLKDQPVTKQPGNATQQPGNAQDKELDIWQTLAQIKQDKADLTNLTQNILLATNTLAALEAKCPRWREIIALITNQLTEPDRQKIVTHLATCGTCHEFQTALLSLSVPNTATPSAPAATLAATLTLAATPTLTATPALVPTAITPTAPVLTVAQRFLQAVQQLKSVKKGQLKMLAATLTSPINSSPTTVNAVANQYWRPDWRPGSLAAGFAAALLAGLATYYWMLPPADPHSAKSAIAINSAARANANLDNYASDAARPLTAELIKEIEKLVKSFQFEKAELLLNPALKKAYASNDKVAQVKLLYLQGQIFSEKTSLSKAIATLNQAIGIANQLNDPHLLLGPVLTLANIYHITDQNAAAAAQAQKCLKLAQQTQNLPYQIASLQSLAINSFLAHQSIPSEELLEQSITLAQQQKDFYTMAHGYAYLGIIKTERSQFDVAKQHFHKALDLVGSISDFQRRDYLGFVINGYYARSQALAGNTKLAIALYQLAITKLNAAGVRQYLSLSQLNYGLSQCLRAQNRTLEAEKTLVKAELFSDEAYKRCELGNLAMSFALVRQVVRRCED
jgi:hypothetical protein